MAQTPKWRGASTRYGFYGLYVILGENVASASLIILTEIQFEAMFYGGPKAKTGDRRETGVVVHLSDHNGLWSLRWTTTLEHTTA